MTVSDFQEIINDKNLMEKCLIVKVIHSKLAKYIWIKWFYQSELDYVVYTYIRSCIWHVWNHTGLATLQLLHSLGIDIRDYK